MYCTNCGRKIVEGTKYCPVCGEKILLVPPDEKAPDSEPYVEKETDFAFGSPATGFTKSSSENIEPEHISSIREEARKRETREFRSARPARRGSSERKKFEAKKEMRLAGLEVFSHKISFICCLYSRRFYRLYFRSPWCEDSWDGWRFLHHFS